MSNDNNQSVASAGSQPPAWHHAIALVGWNIDGSLLFVDSWSHASKSDSRLHLTLTDEELRAIRRAAAVANEMHDYRLKAALGGLLERLK